MFVPLLCAGFQRKRRKDSYKAATRGEPVSEGATQQPAGKLNGFDDIAAASQNKSKPALSKLERYKAQNKFRTIYEAPELRHGSEERTLRSARSMDMLTSLEMTSHRHPVANNALGKKALSLSSLQVLSADQKASNITNADPQNKASKSIRRYRHNLFVISVGLMLVFSAFKALQNLQSSLNAEQKLGVSSMSLLHGSMVLTCLFIPGLVNKITSKWTIVVGVAFYMCWIGANFYPRFFTLIPTSLGAGFGQSLTWGAQVIYFHQLSELHADVTQQMTQNEIIKSNGIFMAIFQTSHIWGNLLSSVLLASAQNYSSHQASAAVNVTDAGGQWLPEHKCGTYDTALNQCESMYINSTCIYRILGILHV